MATMQAETNGREVGTRHRVRLIVASLAVLGGLVGAVLVFTQTGAEAPTTDSVTATLRLDGRPNGLAAGSDALWVALIDREGELGGSLVRLDLATGDVDTRVPLRGVPSFTHRVGESLWVENGSSWDDTKGAELVELDWTTGEIRGRRTFDQPVFDFAAGQGSLWAVVGRAPATVVRLDPATRETIGKPITISPTRVIVLAYGEGALWASASEQGTLVRVDPGTGRVDSVQVGDFPVGVAFAGGDVWVANRSGGTVSRVDPSTMKVVDTIGVGTSPTWIAAVGDSVWVSNQPDGTVTRIDSETGRTIGSPIKIAPPAKDAAAHVLATADGSLWVASATEQTVSRIDPDPE